ncbi:SGNH hydrolase [Lentzea aerocolonigenes]|uniref:SGNH hydrolase n=1 Tax=Lentzea aerocolonigenes TaxID=68170 RepID=A0A0F0GS92_LENAE|nr:SGNH/GDSL hydrolase family protein [Lentzea aerocolonigenes]KJK44278.1 SGNH hydrolase [Lentzea aerocolonigenes]
MTRFLLAVALFVAAASPAQAAPARWVGTWATAPSSAVPGTDNGYPNFSMRNIVHVSAGGKEIRVRLSNAYGRAPIQFGAVTVARAAGQDTPTALPGTMRTLTFGGSTSITAPPGSDVISDGVHLDVPADSDLLVSVFTPSPGGPVTHHSLTMQNSYFTRDGNRTSDESGAAYNERTTAWHYVSGVDVRTTTLRGSVVALGDSITDGANSTWGANLRWPDQLADRVNTRLGVLNAGISGNRLLLDSDWAGPNALSRLNRDVLTQTGVRSVIVFEGINDIQQTPHETDPAKIIAALRQIAQRAHDRGLRVIGATITPFKGWNSYTSELEAVRQAVNTFIRGSKDFDAIIDFDAVIRDPADPQRIRPDYDQGDHLHPGDKGFEAMAKAVKIAAL